MIVETTNALLDTLRMVAISGLIAAIFGLPLGVLLSITRKGNFWENKIFYYPMSFIINATRSIPFIILMLAIIPLTRMLVGTSIGVAASCVPLSLAAIPFFARIVEISINDVPQGLIDAGTVMGATVFQIIYKILIPESLPGIISGFTITLINLVGYSAMAGAIGGGGLGSLAYHYGYQRFDTSVMITTIIILILLVQFIQSFGDYVVHKIRSN